jgi:hypothetical protein
MRMPPGVASGPVGDILNNNVEGPSVFKKARN